MLWRIRKYRWLAPALLLAALFVGAKLYAGTLGSTVSTTEFVQAPVGSVIGWLTATPPTNYLECDGSAISRTTYATLFAVIGTTFGVGDGSTTFDLPDFRGEFLRGWDHTAGTDPDAATRTDRGDGTGGDNVGSKQACGIESHAHNLYMQQSAATGSATYTGATSGSEFAAVKATGSNETRPTNVYVMWAIRYQ